MILFKRFVALLLCMVCLRAAGLPDLKEVLASQADLWGDAAMQQPGGASYAFFEKLLPPLRYVNTSYREYPLVLSAPLAEHKGRWVSDGRGVNIPAHPEDNGIWYGYPIGVTFHVGAGDEVFGHEHTQIKGPRFEKGFLPIVSASYRGVEEEAFAATTGPWAQHGVMLVKLSGNGPVAAAVDCPTALHLQGNALRDAKGRTYLMFSEGWTWDEKTKRLNADSGKAVYLAVFSDPVVMAEGNLDAGLYDRLCDACAETWNGWIKRCAEFEVPEEIVQRAWKCCIVANLMIASGDRMYYSGGNVYANMWVSENGDAARDFSSYGLLDTTKDLTGGILRVKQEGLDDHNAGFKLQYVAAVYWMTRDAAYVEKYRKLWQPEADLILNHRQKESGLLPKEFYCGDIHTPVDSLSANSNAWRGLRDMAAVLAEIGKADESAKLYAAAGEFKKAILDAIAKSERTDVKPAFIPVALFGLEKPYGALTTTMAGTYWNLMIPYVMGSGILDENRTNAVLEYMQTHGALCMGMLRIHQHSGLFANEDGLDDGYTSRYFQAIAHRDEPERMLVSLYGKLAQGFTRDTFVGAEGSSLVALDPGGRPMYLPPNSTSNGFFLAMLRDLLVQDDFVDEKGVPNELRLMFATPRAWLADGKSIVVKNAPTVFGNVSVVAKSDLSHAKVVVEVTPPERAAKQMRIRVRVPDGWKVIGGEIGAEKLVMGADATFDITGRTKPFTLLARVTQEHAATEHHYSDHSKLMEYVDDAGAVHPVKTAADWERRRQDILKGMQAVMGELPDRAHLPPLDVKVTERFVGDHFLRLKLTFVSQGTERVPAYLFVPIPAAPGNKYPAMLALHQTIAEGKMEPAGLAGDKPYGEELAKRGYVVICPDYPSFGEYPFDFHGADYHFVSGTMKGIFNHMRCVDLLCERPEVDAEHIGVIGHSLGGHNSLFMASFDERIKAVVTSCGWTPFADYMGGNITGWTSDRYMPRLRDVYHLKASEVPFDFYEVIAAIAPRAVLSISPTRDANFSVDGVRKAIAAVQPVYELLGAPDALQAIYPDGEHSFPPESRQKAYAFLDAHLRDGK